MAVRMGSFDFVLPHNATHGIRGRPGYGGASRIDHGP